ncbi:MAG: VWA domain-containing protein, partial [Candidatus Tectomicrobia bacterium]|nr:VWA domain-containing protein [Candidatus Tectomicrobia bacterium]
MRSIITRVARLLHSPRASFSLFALLMVGTAAVALAPRATGGSGHMPTPLPVPQPVPVSNQDASGVTFTGVFSQTKLVQGGNGVVYLDLRIKAPTAAAAVAPQASDFIVVLDRSGSMAADNRLPYAKEAIRALLSRLHAEDRFALVTFDTTAAVHTALTPVTNQAREQIMRQVNLLRPGASTNLSDGLLQAQALLQAPVGERRRKVLLLSDGEANAGIVAPRELAKIAASFTQQQAVLSTIGMGLGFNETLMASLADYGMGHYGYLEHLEKLGDILQHDIHNTRQVFASASSLEITLGDGVTVTDVGGYPLDTTTQPGTVRVATGQLLGGAQKQFTVTFAMPTHHLGALALGPITLHYTTAQGQAHLALPREHLQLAVLES